MTRTLRLPAFAGGVAAVLITYAWLVVVDAQPADTAIVDVCADADGAMRLTAPEVACAAGERRLRLKGPELQKPCEEPRADVATLNQRLSELERAVDARRQSSPAIAPFEVVNEAGIRVFSVEQFNPGIPDQFVTEFHNDTGQRVGVVSVTAEGGSLSLFAGGGADSLSATISARGTDVGVAITDAQPRLRLGRRENGRYGVQVFSRAGKMVAGIGESEVGSGIALVADADGTPRVSMFRHSETRNGHLAIANAAGQQVATLSGAGFQDSGLLQLTNASGTVMVEAGTVDTGVGFVRAGPGAFRSGLMFAGLPGSYIVGKK